MNVIYKYTFEIEDAFGIEMPQGAMILKAEMQGKNPCIWALVNPDALREVREFRVLGTGHHYNFDHLVHVATFQQGLFVWHLFESI